MPVSRVESAEKTKKKKKILILNRYFIIGKPWSKLLSYDRVCQEPSETG